MTKFWRGILVCLLGVVMLGAGGESAQNRFGRVGHKMMCVCSCNQILLDCNHVGCPDSSKMIGELQDRVDAGGDDAAVMKWFESKYGATVLAAPIRGGFDTVAWIVPMALLIIAVFGTAFVVRAWVARRTLAGEPGRASPGTAEDLVRERIRRETEY